MAMITELTPEQVALQTVVADEWLDKATKHTCPISKGKEWMEWLYALGNEKCPPVFEVISPLAAQYVCNHLSQDSVKQGDFSSLEKVDLFDINQLKKLSLPPVNRREYIATSRLGIGFDCGWTAYYDYWERIGIEYPPEVKANWDIWKELVTELWDCHLFNECVILIRKPKFVRLDDRFRLHCLDGPALEWEDGFANYFIHGVAMDKEVILNPKKITVKKILNESNVEVRKGLIQIRGLEWFLKAAKAVEVDRDIECAPHPTKGIVQNERRLFRFAAGQDGGQAIEWCVIEVTCPSKGDKHYLWVDPASTSCKDAIARSFRRTVDTYQPTLEA